MRFFALFPLTVVLCFAAPPTISNIQYDSLTHASVRWVFTVNPASYVQIKYGTTSWSYPYSSNSYGGQTVGAISIGGLQPNTTYYFRMTARPNKDDDTDICQEDSCGSVEQSITTPPEPAQHPELPIGPTIYNPQHPDTSGYTVVPMQVGATGECAAAADVAAQLGWNKAVRANDTIPTILKAIGYGTVVEFPQGAVCKVFPTDSTWNTGYVLPVLPIDPNAGGNMDSPAHRWIVFRTAASNSADFPPFGARTGPKWGAKMAKLVAQVPATSPSGASTNTGQIFDSYNISPHHFWFENLELTHTTDTSVTPADAVDPKPFSMLIRIQPLNALPQYIVFDRLYAHGGGFPHRTVYGLSLGGRNEAMLGCYLTFDFWRMAAWPSADPTLADSNTRINIPQSTFQRNINDAPIGMSNSATAVLSAPTTYTGTVVGFLGPDGLTIQYKAGDQVSISCAGCTASAVDVPAAPANRYRYFTANISNGQFTGLTVNSKQWTTTAWGDWKPMAFTLLPSGTGPFRIENNYFGSPGQTVYVDPSGTNIGSFDDVVFRRNHIFWNQDHRPNSSTWNGYRYDVRNMFEVKRGRRWLVDGNIFEGAWSYQNAGYSILIPGAYPYDPTITNAGTMDFTITNNIIRHSASGWQCAGAGSPAVDPPMAQRFLFQNNLLYDLNRLIYDDGGPSMMAGYVTILPGCQDVTIRQNTFGLALGRGPYLMLTGGGSAFGEGLSVTDNIMYMSFGDAGPRAISHDGTQNIPSHPRLPLVDATTSKSILDTYFVRTGATVVPSYVFNNNVIIGGKTKYGLPAWRDLTQSEVDTYAGQLPAGNIFPKGNSLAARQATLGFAGVQYEDYRLTQGSPYKSGGRNAATTGGDMGVNYTDLESAIGVVTNVSPPQVGRIGALFSYTSPDGNACSVDTSPDGISWARVSDGGGARSRVVVVTGLNPGTEYQYRILCYYEQINDQATMTPYRDDQITNGSFTTSTVSAVASTQTITTAIPPTLKAQSVVAEYGTTPSLGNATTPISCPQRCTLALPATIGSPLFYRLRYQDRDSAVLAYSNLHATIAR